MDVILLEKVHNLGNLGERVRVKPGFGRNYLIPQKKAVAATAANIAAFEARRAELERAQADALGRAQARAAQVADMAVTIRARAGSEGKLFGSVGTVDIAEAVTAAGAEIERREVRLPGGPLRELGAHRIDLHLHADVTVAITVHIVPEEDTGATTRS
jgi:large subunit ribosomal protein L9